MSRIALVHTHKFGCSVYLVSGDYEAWLRAAAIAVEWIKEIPENRRRTILEDIVASNYEDAAREYIASRAQEDEDFDIVEVGDPVTDEQMFVREAQLLLDGYRATKGNADADAGEAASAQPPL